MVAPAMESAMAAERREGERQEGGVYLIKCFAVALTRNFVLFCLATNLSNSL